MADIPGLIEGAAEGAGLGIRFLKHIQRTRLLLHLVDVAPIDENESPAETFRAIEAELVKFSDDLSAKPRWLVINKIDLLPAEDRESAKDRLVTELGWEGPVFLVSAETGEGTEALGQAVMQALEEMAESVEDPDID
jgi:GTP-binding protein